MERKVKYGCNPPTDCFVCRFPDCKKSYATKTYEAERLYRKCGFTLKKDEKPSANDIDTYIDFNTMLDDQELQKSIAYRHYLIERMFNDE